jgi:hypothetical protein
MPKTNKIDTLNREVPDQRDYPPNNGRGSGEAYSGGGPLTTRLGGGVLPSKHLLLLKDFIGVSN